MAISASAGTITGNLQLASGTPLKNATLGFTPSQVGYSSVGGFVMATTPVPCNTDINGAIVGLPNPSVVPTFQLTPLGMMPAGTYFVQITYYGAGGETTASPELQFVLNVPEILAITPPALKPVTATGYKVYIGTASGNEKLQGSNVGFAGSFIQNSPINTGSAAPPVSNSTICTLVFNDSIVPTYTTYKTTLVDSGGLNVPGFPQNYYFTGTTVNLSTLQPAGNLKALFSSAVISNPPSFAGQSINGPLSLSGFPLTNIGALSLTNGANTLFNIDSTGKATEYFGNPLKGIGMPAIVGNGDMGLISAAIPTTSLFNTGATGAMYRVNYYIVVTRAATTSSAVQLTITSNDGFGPNTLTSANLNANTPSAMTSGTLVLFVAGLQPINYSTSYSSVGATTMQYSIFVHVDMI